VVRSPGERVVSYARWRFGSAVCLTVIGAVLAVGALTLPAGTERWLAFATGCAVLVTVLAAFVVPRRGALQRAIDLPTVLVAVWLIVSARAIEVAGAGSSPGAIKWLNLGGGAAICAFGLIGLLAHEWGLERDLRLINEARAARSAAPKPAAGAPAPVATYRDDADIDVRQRIVRV
jgi:hypothetical protein